MGLPLSHRLRFLVGGDYHARCRRDDRNPAQSPSQRWYRRIRIEKPRIGNTDARTAQLW